MKEFKKAVRRATTEDAEAERWMEFQVYGPGEDDVTTCRALAEPSGGQIAYFMSKNLSHIPPTERLGAMLNFFDSALDDRSQAYIIKRLLDPNDPYDIDDIQDVMMWLMEEWSARPTKSQSGSTGLRQPNGPSSTPITERPTYSPFQQTASATSSMPGYTNGPQPPIF